MAININRETYEVFVDRKPIYMAPREFDTLAALVDAKGRVLSRAEILRDGWGIRYDHETDKDPRTVDQHIMRIRRKLGKHQHKIISVFRRGYRFKK